MEVEIGLLQSSTSTSNDLPTPETGAGLAGEITLYCKEDMELSGDLDRSAIVTLHSEEGTDTAVISLEVGKVWRDFQGQRAEEESVIYPTPRVLV